MCKEELISTLICLHHIELILKPQILYQEMKKWVHCSQDNPFLVKSSLISLKIEVTFLILKTSTKRFLQNILIINKMLLLAHNINLKCAQKVFNQHYKLIIHPLKFNSQFNRFKNKLLLSTISKINNKMR